MEWIWHHVFDKIRHCMWWSLYVMTTACDDHCTWWPLYVMIIVRDDQSNHLVFVLFVLLCRETEESTWFSLWHINKAIYPNTRLCLISHSMGGERASRSGCPPPVAEMSGCPPPVAEIQIINKLVKLNKNHYKNHQFTINICRHVKFEMFTYIYKYLHKQLQIIRNHK